nr:hypothetical protein [Tanacetum cinerariifolium]
MWLSESWYVLMWLNEESGYRWFIKMKIDESIKRYQFWVIGQRWCLKNKGAISDANKNLSVKGRNSRNTDVSVECLQEHMIRNWFRGLEIDIKAIIFSDLMHKLQNGKKNREANICYTRFLSLIFKKLLGEKYINDSLTFVKPHTISAASFKKPLASESIDLSQAKALGIPPPPELSTFGRNLIPPPCIEGSRGRVIREPESGIEGLTECKASVSNLRCIQVKDIVKEVKDHLKTYSSDVMDINWYVEGIHYGNSNNLSWRDKKTCKLGLSIGKTNDSTSCNGTFYLSNLFEVLNVDTLSTEEVNLENKASKSGVQEESQSSTPLVEKISMFEQQPLEEKCVLVNDKGKPLENFDYTGDHDSEDEVEHVDNEMASYLAIKPSGVGYGTNSLLEK